MGGFTFGKYPSFQPIHVVNVGIGWALAGQMPANSFAQQSHLPSHAVTAVTGGIHSAAESRSDCRNVAGGFAFGKCKGGKLKPAFKRAVPQAFGLSPF
jgi:hypothetical protein